MILDVSVDKSHTRVINYTNTSAKAVKIIQIQKLSDSAF